MLSAFILIPIVLAIVIYMLSFKDGKQVCDNYVLISYLYALFYICLTAYISIMAFVNYPAIFKYVVDKNLDLYVLSMVLLFVMILYLVVFFVTIILPPRFLIAKHLLSILVVILGGILLSIIFVSFAPDAIFIALILTILLFLILTFVAWKFQDYIASSVNMVFFIIFLILILLEGIMLIFFPNSILTTIVILIVLSMLCYILLVRTKRIIENDKKCEIPDYVNEGLGLLLSFKNLFIQILELRSRRR